MTDEDGVVWQVVALSLFVWIGSCKRTYTL